MAQLDDSGAQSGLETIAGSGEQATGTLATLAASDEVDAGAMYRPRAHGRSRAPEPGARIGRYVVLERVGAGAMGVVFAAYDPKLERRVAIKLVDRRRSSSPAERRRLLQEAQALAQLNHPNVVAVHDAGEFAGQVFVAMEFVRGVTLTRWLEQQGARGWPQVLEVLIAAGEGLAAAHARGLVHRDFKPDNVMVGDDGRVRVMDFGLARLGELEPVASSSGVLPSIGGTGTGTGASLDGTLVGTPAYMSPEQFELQPATAAADQFAFCVVLHEALYGQRPFAGESPQAIAFNVLHGAPREAARGSGVPRWLQRIVSRGLARSPELRHADMRALLLALGSGQARRRRERIVLAGAAVAALVGAGYGYQRWELGQREARCVAAGAVIDDSWSASTSARVGEALLATEVPYAQTVAERVSPWIERRCREWRRARTDACRRVSVTRTWTPAQFDKAAWCLEEQRVSIDALVGTLAEVDEAGALTAVQAAAKLDDPAVCVDEGALAGLPAPPRAQEREQVLAVRGEVSRAFALREAGRVAEGVELASHAREAAEQLDWEPIVARALAVEATLQLSAGDYDASEATGRRAYLSGVRSSAWGVAAEAASALIFTIGFRQSRPREGLLWAELAEAATHHAGDPTRLREASRKTSVAAVAMREGELERAVEVTMEVVEIVEEVLGPEHPHTALAINNLAIMHQERGAHARARELSQRALASWEATLGPEHPYTAAGLSSVGMASMALGELDAAADALERALEIRVRGLGEAHPLVEQSREQLEELRKEQEQETSLVGDQSRSPD